MDHMLGPKTSVNKLKIIEIISSAFFPSQWNETKNEQWKDYWKIHKYMQIKELLINQKIKGEIKREIRKYFETNEKCK